MFVLIFFLYNFLIINLNLGYCPPGQILYTELNDNDASVPLTCHMTLRPCPTTAPYQCIYSSKKQNSYCCAPLDMTKQLHHNLYSNLKQKSKKKNKVTKYLQQQFHQLHQLQKLKQLQQEIQYQQPSVKIDTEYSAAIAKNQNGCSEKFDNLKLLAPEISIEYPNDNSKIILAANAQLLSQQQEQQKYLAGLSNGVDVNLNALSTLVSQYPPTTVIDPSAGNNIFVASCPPWSKPLLNLQTQLGHACSSW